MVEYVYKRYAYILQYLEKHPTDISAYRDLLDLCISYDDVTTVKEKVLPMVNSLLVGGTLGEVDKFELHKVSKKCNLFLAPHFFHNYCVYLEWDREPQKRFYSNRYRSLRPIVDALQKLADDKLDLLCVSMPPGVGKALADDTPVLTRNGWKNHGDLVVGDEVIGLDGKFKKVTHVHPKCMLDCLVEFSNGEKIQCHENHEWMLRDRASGGDYKTKETKEWEKRKLHTGAEEGRGHRYVLQLPPRFVEGEQKDLFSPYVLGVWLGDGANNNPRITNDVRDAGIIAKIHTCGYWEKQIYHQKRQPNTLWFDFGFRKELSKYGMCHSRKRTEKHIPEEYLTASIEQRLELLAGLIDTDGCRTGNKYQFSTCDVSLRDSVRDLLHTFGWRVCEITYEPSVSSSGITGRKKTYVLSFTPDRVIPCALERKRNANPPKQNKIALTSITRVEPKQGNCITVEGDGMYLAGKTMIPTHNTTLALFFLTWMGGRMPDKQILGASHNTSFLRGCYDQILRILGNDGEYLYNDVFPKSPLVNTNAKDLRIDLETPKRFETFEFTSVGSGNAGKVRATSLLYCDDLVDGIETALSITQLDKLWMQYTADLRQRKQGDACKELHIATRWSVHDVIGRLEDIYGDDPRSEFVVVPALDADGESNFDYPYGLGFSRKMYEEQRDIMDDISWRTIYMNQPIEREALVFEADKLQRYMELPAEEPDAVISVCDTKDGGQDYFSAPVAYLYGDRVFIADVVYDNSLPEVVLPRITQKYLDHKVMKARFESNSAGGRMAVEVQKALKDKGSKCSIVTKYTTKNKLTKILVNADYVKQHFIFADDSIASKEYREFMSALCSFSHTGKNKHDDAPDSLAMLVDFLTEMTMNTVQIVKRPF